MINFQELFDGFQRGNFGFVSVSLDIDSANSLYDLLISIGVSNPVEPEEMHATVAYDENNPYIKGCISNNVYKMYEPFNIERMGNVGSKWEAIAVQFTSSSLKFRHNDFVEMGIKSKYPSFIPHLSLVYQPDIEDLNKIINNQAKIIEILQNAVLKNEQWKSVIKD
ncbi:hypothetical protein [uncultured Arcobacter sp.]|uniref:hypothetical protein n=1 Tax=uncultured Arcobacter sp. TaxID=165434 RepID=UPI002604EB70|nr:hypothetical protein [uncultured Arcobacter sp.]